MKYLGKSKLKAATQEEGDRLERAGGGGEVKMRACLLSQDTGWKVSMLKALLEVGTSGNCSLRREHGS